MKECWVAGCTAHAPRNAGWCPAHRDTPRDTIGGGSVIITAGDGVTGAGGNVFIRGGAGGPRAHRIVDMQSTVLTHNRHNAPWGEVTYSNNINAGGGGPDPAVTEQFAEQAELIRQQSEHISAMNRQMLDIVRQAQIDAERVRGMQAQYAAHSRAQIEARTFEGEIESVSVHGGRLAEPDITVIYDMIQEHVAAGGALGAIGATVDEMGMGALGATGATGSVGYSGDMGPADLELTPDEIEDYEERYE